MGSDAREFFKEAATEEEQRRDLALRIEHIRNSIKYKKESLEYHHQRCGSADRATMHLHIQTIRDLERDIRFWQVNLDVLEERMARGVYDDGIEVLPGSGTA